MARNARIAIAVSLLMVAAGLGPAAAQTDTGDEAQLQAATAALNDLDHRSALGQAAALEDEPLAEPPAIEDAAEALAVLAGPQLDVAEAEQRLADVPEPMHEGLERLLVGMAQAQVLVDRALADAGMSDVSSEEVHRALAAGESWKGLVHQAHDGETALEAEPAPPMPEQRITGVDEAPFVLAQALLTDAMLEAEAAFPSGLGGAGQPGGHAGQPGDVVDERPYLIVSSQAAHHYEEGDDAIVIVDLGGNDDYDNAQGSPFADGRAQVIADLGGDDSYVDTASGTSGPITLATQGAGVAGVGGLLDAGGDDVFHARASYASTDDSVSTRLFAQGAGALGAGAFVALGGQDCLTAETRSHGAAAFAAAQGAGALGGGSAVFHAQPAAECPVSPSLTAISDPRVIVDDGDAFQAELGPATAIGQGGARGGAGSFAGGTQAHSYEARAEGGQASTIAQGAAEIGVGLHADAGGSDERVADALGEAELSVHLSGSFSFVGASATINLGGAETLAQGATAAGSAGLLDAGPGPDAYQATSAMRATASAHAETTFSDGITEASATVDLEDTRSLGHGAAEAGLAVHTSASGPVALPSHDSYLLGAEIDAHSDATAKGGSDNTASATTRTGDAQAGGLGQAMAGGGVYADAGGDDDRRLVANLEATADATASPSGSETETVDAGQERTDGPAEATVGAGILADVGGDDTYTNDPGSTPAGDDRCWTEGNAPNVGLGVDVGSGPPSLGCVPP